jgi:hypothetical protein
MEHRWMKGVVVLFWMVTMTWLVVEKVLPPLERGDPPTFHSAWGSLDPHAPPVGWFVDWNGRRIGWAASRILQPSSGLLEIYSRVHFSRWPLEDLVPVWMRTVLHEAVSSLGGLEMDAYNQLDIDPLNRLVGFCSTIHLKKVPQAIVVEGTIEKNRLRLRVDAGGNSFTPPEHTLPQDALLVDELSPQATLIGLHDGQRWTVPVFNPLQPDSPMDVVEATVKGHETLDWYGKSVAVFMVTYQNDSGAELGMAQTPRQKLWVTSDGTVLRQEAWLFDSRLSFIRMSPDDSAKYTANLDETLQTLPFGHAAEKTGDDRLPPATN